MAAVTHMKFNILNSLPVEPFNGNVAVIDDISQS